MFVDQTVYHGRAEDTNRLDKELRCYDLLDRLGLSYDRVDHDAADTIEACAAVEQVLGAGICKNLFLTNRQQTAFYLLLMPGHKPFRTKDLSHQIGSARLSFASPEHMLELLDITPGSVSVLGLMTTAMRACGCSSTATCWTTRTSAATRASTRPRSSCAWADAVDVLIPALGARADVCRPAGICPGDLRHEKKKILHPRMQDFL